MNLAVQTIAREVRQHGVLPFARFMELALYCPLCGYYEQEADNVGRRGDFFTSVSVGSLFGELLAFQFAEWLSAFGTRGGPPTDGGIQVVEAGAHDGRLAQDIMGWLRLRRPDLFATLQYWIIEPSTRRQKWQRGRLREFQQQVRWFPDVASLLADHRVVNGIIFSNEFLDALPVRRLGWDARARTWFEWGVALAGDCFAWARLREGDASPEMLVGLLKGVGLLPSAELLAVLPDDFTVEVCPVASQWWHAAARLLARHGKLVTFDYGLEADEFFAAPRQNGTLRAYRQHCVSGDVLADPGGQDLTAHVNFTALRFAGETCGLTTDRLSTQAQFLVAIAQQAWREPQRFGGWDAERLRQFKTLTHPEHLGRSFRVLVQSRAA